MNGKKQHKECYVFQWHSDGKHFSVVVIGNSYGVKSGVEASSEVGVEASSD